MNSLPSADGERKLFSRHLDLRPLRGRRRGLVKCIFHADRTPSLSVDLDRGLFYCHGCGVGGGLRRFAEQVGEEVKPSRPARPRSPLDEARARVRTEAERQRRRLDHDPYIIADHLRPRFQAIAEARRVGTTMGPTERAWEILDGAAHAEREAVAVESELDSLLPLPWREDLDATLVGRRP